MQNAFEPLGLNPINTFLLEGNNFNEVSQYLNENTCEVTIISMNYVKH